VRLRPARCRGQPRSGALRRRSVPGDVLALPGGAGHGGRQLLHFPAGVGRVGQHGCDLVSAQVGDSVIDGSAVTCNYGARSARSFLEHRKVADRVRVDAPEARIGEP
jgi:hypothetical protein